MSGVETLSFNPDQARDDYGRWTDTTSINQKEEVAKQEALAANQSHPLAHPDFVLGEAEMVDQRAVRRYVAAYGQEFKAAPLPDNQRRMPMGECYKNASLMVMANPELDYAEGYAQNAKIGDLVFQHAWGVTKDGSVVDPTWDSPEKNTYFGVRYDREKYLAYLVKAKLYGVIGSTDKNVRKAVETGGNGLRKELKTAGGAGSGNFGHSGRPGEVGGSSKNTSSVEMRASPWPKTLVEAEDRIRREINEHGFSARDGKIVNYVGQDQRASVHLGEIKNVGSNDDPYLNATFTHNHPDGTGLSPNDVFAAASHNMREMRAVNESGAYVVRRGERWPDPAGLVEKARSYSNTVRQDFQSKIIAGTLTIDQAKRQHWSEVWARVEKDVNKFFPLIKFSFEPHGS